MKGDTAILVIGARSLIGRRLREMAPDAWFTSRHAMDGHSLVLDTEHPEALRTDRRFTTVIMCAPVWLMTADLLERLYLLGMRRLVAFSSTSVITKEASADLAERGVVAKLQAGEKTIEAFCAVMGVAYTILRPTLIYDEGLDENVSAVAATIRKYGFFPVCGRAEGLRQPVHARDLARAALLVADEKRSYNKSYNLGGGETLAYRDMVLRVFKSLTKQPIIVVIPEFVWRLGFLALNLLPRRGPKRNVEMVLRMNRDLRFDNAPAAHDFGYAPRPFQPKFSHRNPVQGK